MERTQSTGWRTPGPVVSHLELRNAEKNALYEACRLAVKALDLKPAARFVLETLCSFYRGEQIGDRMLVWPSNELLGDRTGLSERAIRYAVRQLIELGVVGSKDSANGKRYARKSPQGQILDAFGFDLAPLLGRVDEWKQRHQALKDLERERKGQFDEITICRRQAMELLIAQPDDALEAAFDVLARATPRRSSSAAVGDVLALWHDLLSRVTAHYSAACAGNDCRQKDTNNEPPDQSCKQGYETVGLRSVDLTDLVEATPSVWRWGRTPKDMRGLVAEASGELRGAIGIHRSAWEEAAGKLGPIAAAAALALVMQHDLDGQKTGRMIKSPGGYFRAYIRKVADGQIDLIEEIARFKRKRHH